MSNFNVIICLDPPCGIPLWGTVINLGNPEVSKRGRGLWRGEDGRRVAYLGLRLSPGAQGGPGQEQGVDSFQTGSAFITVFITVTIVVYTTVRSLPATILMRHTPIIPILDSFQTGSGQTELSQNCRNFPSSMFMGKCGNVWQTMATCCNI